MSAERSWLEYEEFGEMAGVAHRFVLRQPGIDVEGEREEVIERLSDAHFGHLVEMGFPKGSLVLAEQVHGCGVAVVGPNTPAGTIVRGVDGLISNVPGKVMGIYVADCCPVFLADEEAGSLGLVHSGKKGSELNIVGAAIELMVKEHGAEPGRMQVRLGPCIRPPSYEVDFAAKIRADSELGGVPSDRIRDDGTCTSTDLKRFYSYRMEKGRTGRMLALFGRR